MQKKMGEAGKNKKLKKEKLGASGKGLKAEAASVSANPRVKSELVMPTL